jgi:hypothetical protein
MLPTLLRDSSVAQLQFDQVNFAVITLDTLLVIKDLGFFSCWAISAMTTLSSFGVEQYL